MQLRAFLYFIMLMETSKYFEPILTKLERLPLKVVVKCRTLGPILFISDKQTVIVEMKPIPENGALLVKGKSETEDRFSVIYDDPEEAQDLIVNMISAFALSVTRYPAD